MLHPDDLCNLVVDGALLFAMCAAPGCQVGRIPERALAVGQRGVIKQGEQWVDSRLRVGTEEQQKSELQVQAYSEAHFQLSRSFPRMNGLLAVSDDMLVLINGHVVQIGEEGKTSLDAEDLELLGVKAGEDVGAAPTDTGTEIAALSAAPAVARMVGLGAMLLFAGVIAVRRRA